MLKAKKLIPVGCEGMSAPTYYNYSGRNQDILKRPCVLLFGYETIQTVNPNKLEFPEKSHAGERKGWEPSAGQRVMFS